MPDLDGVPADVAARANLLFLNYPNNNPTGAIVAPGAFERAVEYARRNDLILVHYNAYRTCLARLRAAELRDRRSEGGRSRDLLAFQRLEHDRLARRLGGRERQGRRAVSAAEDEPRFGMFDALQLAGVAALTEAGGFPAEMSEIYRRRRDLMIDALADIGLPQTRRVPPRTSGCGCLKATRRRRSQSPRSKRPELSLPWLSFGPVEGATFASRTVADERLEEAGPAAADRNFAPRRDRGIIRGCDPTPAGSRARGRAGARLPRRRAGPGR